MQLPINLTVRSHVTVTKDHSFSFQVEPKYSEITKVNYTVELE